MSGRGKEERRDTSLFPVLLSSRRRFAPLTTSIPHRIHIAIPSSALFLSLGSFASRRCRLTTLNLISLRFRRIQAD
ncbi:unnamed protein product [Rhodiola kirilowii]